MTILVSVILLSAIFGVQGQGIGDRCIVQYNRQAGTCKAVANCPKVLQDYRNRGIQPTLCGWAGFTQIVCCPGAAPIPVTTTTTTTTTTTQRPTTTKVPTANRTYTTKSAQNCARYQEYVYEYVKFGALVDGGDVNKRKVDRCGHKTVALIVGGEAAKPREFPHMALIGYGEPDAIEYLCGGSLISENFVLSAGHCASGRAGPAAYVRLGEFDKYRTDDDARVEDFNIIQVIPHPAYKSSSQYNDIALFKLDRNAKLSPYVRPLCLPDKREIKERKAIASGWGRIGWTDDLSEQLLKVTLDFFPHDECAESYGTNRKLPNGIMENQQLCAGSHDDNKDTCEGDSGGPLQVFHPDLYCMYQIVGITSFGKGCGLQGQPAVYARVFEFVPWIESVVWP
ncbi:serine protease snake-like [Culicoides brevitarsis]|uniref:serine protease snake-like n=1 Tax=Culicoides brevitarsis TaxID=469753 RepID=UPI00307B6316